MNSVASKKHKEHCDLADRIVRFGVLMDPCSNCVRRNHTCFSSSNSNCCTKCVRRGIKCNQGGFDLSSFAAIQREEEQLEMEEEEAIAKILCLRKQRRSLKVRAKDMLKHRLKTLDELDKAEAKEREEREVQERAAVTSAPPANPSWFELLSEEQLNRLFADFPEGTAEQQPLY